jgi:hypothetical protein
MRNNCKGDIGEENLCLSANSDDGAQCLSDLSGLRLVPRHLTPKLPHYVPKSRGPHSSPRHIRFFFEQGSLTTDFKRLSSCSHQVVLWAPIVMEILVQNTIYVQRSKDVSSSRHTTFPPETMVSLPSPEQAGKMDTSTLHPTRLEFPLSQWGVAAPCNSESFKTRSHKHKPLAKDWTCKSI